MVAFDGMGSKETYAFTVPAAGRAVYLDSLAAAPVGGVANWTLSNSTGVVLSNRNAATDVVVDSRASGTHTLTVAGSAVTTTGSMRFQIKLPLDITAAATAGATLAAAPSIPATNQIGQNLRFTVPVTAPEIAAGRRN